MLFYKSISKIITYYLLKKSGILIDCSFTVPDGVLVGCNVGIGETDGLTADCLGAVGLTGLS